MQRLDRLPRPQLPGDQRRFHDAVVEVRRAPVQGPFIVAMHASPDMAARVAHLGGYFHDRDQADRSVLPPRVRTLAALLGARALDGVYEWGAWRDRALDAGVPSELVADIRDGREPVPLDALDALVVQAVTQLLDGAHRLAPATFQAAVERFGPSGVVELVATVGYFSMIAIPLNAFEIEFDRADPPTMPIAPTLP